ncbi:hypothetical protein NUACC26_034360 [Scytonema sp. NUACC26]
MVRQKQDGFLECFSIPKGDVYFALLVPCRQKKIISMVKQDFIRI